MGDAPASRPNANRLVVNRVSDLPRSQLSCNAPGIPRARCTCGVAARLPEAEGRAPKGAQAAARVAEGDALAGVR